MKHLLQMMLEFLKEMESLIEADDGTVFQIQHIEQLEEITDLIEETLNESIDT